MLPILLRAHAKAFSSCAIRTLPQNSASRHSYTFSNPKGTALFIPQDTIYNNRLAGYVHTQKNITFYASLYQECLTAFRALTQLRNKYKLNS